MPLKDKQKRLEYNRKYYWEHKEKDNLRAKLRHQEHKEEDNARMRVYFHKHRDLENIRRKQYHKEHYERHLENCRAYHYTNHFKAMQIISGKEKPFCIFCGCDYLGFLEINHKDGNGCEERKSYSQEQFYKRIISGERKTDDLEITCRLHNQIHYLSMKYPPEAVQRFTVVWSSAPNFPVDQNLHEETPPAPLPDLTHLASV
jgi:hypothetical protein